MIEVEDGHARISAHMDLSRVSVRLPSTITAMITHRIDALDPEAGLLCKLGSTFGPFPITEGMLLTFFEKEGGRSSAFQVNFRATTKERVEGISIQMCYV